MKKYIIQILSVTLVISGCSAAYKTGQTPDDVYYSKPRTSQEIVREEASPGDEYQSYFGSTQDDNYLRMKVQNGGKWNSIDDYAYWNGYNGYSPYMSPYSSPYGMYGGAAVSFGITFGSPSYYGGYYSPFYTPYYYSPIYYPVIINKRPVYYGSGYHPSLTGYSNNQYDRGNNIYKTPGQTRSANRNIFNNGNTTNPGTYDNRPSRSFSSGSYSAPSSGGGGGGGGSTGGGGGSRGGRGH